MTLHRIEHWIDGRPSPPAAGGWLDDIDPATGATIARVAAGDAADIDRAVAAAKGAYPAWAGTPVEARCNILDAIADGIEARIDGLAMMETEDTGKPVATSSTIDIPRAVRNFRFFADHARREIAPRHEMETGTNHTVRQPIGVVGLVTPWNLPLYLLSWKTAPALAMGNAVVAKPSEMTPQTADALARIGQEAGLPDGVFNIVHGTGPDAGAPLVAHPDVRAISFTGGTATGAVVAASAAPRFKKLSLELGGKNPGIVFADCDLDATVAGIVRAGFTNQGQVCLCSSRILVDESIHDDFIARLAAAVADLRPGDPKDPAARLGALVSLAHRDKVESYLAMAADEGAQVVCGGVRTVPPGPGLAKGAFLAPAVVAGVAQSSRLVQEEIFGPVVTVQPFGDEAEAIRLANDSRYGLAATVWTQDRERALRVATALETGMVWVNDWLVRDLRVPFGGMKASGVGREGGTYSLDFFSEVRNVYLPHAAGRPAPAAPHTP